VKTIGSKEDVNALRETLESYVGYLNEGKFEEWLSLWEEDGVQMMAFVPAVEGKDEIKKVIGQYSRDILLS
jgi:hypothetical protein